MKYTRIIARAASERLQSHEGMLGVRLSPVELEPDEAPALVRDAEDLLGPSAYVAVSIPGASARETPRLCVSPDQRAAERATAWRNELTVSKGERILYVSVEVHGKAGGLEECLYPLSTADLLSTFLRWIEEGSPGDEQFPQRLSDHLREAEILDYVDPRSLCDLSERVTRDSKRHPPWTAVGRNLPCLSLAVDTKLSGQNAGRRLAANRRFVSIAALSEARQEARLPERVRAAVEQLRKARKLGTPTFEVLRGVDLADIETADLEQVLPQSRRRGTRATTQRTQPETRPKEDRQSRRDEKKGRKQPKGSKKRGTAGPCPADTRRPAGTQGAVRRDTRSVLEEVLTEDPSERERRMEDEASREEPQERPPTKKNEPLSDEAREQERLNRLHKEEYGDLSGELPSGLEILLNTSLGGDGVGLKWSVGERQPRRWLHELPNQLPAPERAQVGDPDLFGAVEGWRTARAAVREAIQEAGPKTITLLVMQPVLALGRRALRSAIDAYLAASVELYEAARQSSDASSREAILNFETLQLWRGEESAIVVLGPLHPLWLSQAAARFSALMQEKEVDPVARRLLVRALSEAPIAPQDWPLSRARLRRTQIDTGLIAYETVTSSVTESGGRAVAQALAHQLLALMPHARSALRVAVRGRNIDGVLRGFADLVNSREDVGRVDVYLAEDAAIEGGEAAERGRLALHPLPDESGGLEAVNPHMVIIVDPVVTRPEHEVPAGPRVGEQGSALGLFTTRFHIDDRGLRTETPVAGHDLLAAFEALHSQSVGRRAVGAFISESSTLSLAALFPRLDVARSAWQVAIGARIGRNPREGANLLLHEFVPDAGEVVAVAENVGPPARALKSALLSLGVQDSRPSVLTHLAEVLAVNGGGGLVSLNRAVHPLLAEGVLGLALRSHLKPAPTIVAPVNGQAYTVLIGGDEGDDSFSAVSVGCAAPGEELRLTVGYAAIGRGLDVSADGNRLRGPLADRLAPLVAALRLADTVRGVNGDAAREAVNWLLWPSLAGAPGATRPRLETALRRLGAGQCRVDVLLLLPPGSRGSTNASKKGPPCLSGVPVTVHTLDWSLLEQLCLEAGPR